VHHEVEILVKINKVGKHIDKKFAHKYYDEIGLGIDFTARDLQTQLKAKGLPWEKAKAFDGSAVIGKWLPKTQFHDINNMSFSLKKNDEVVQQGNTELMLWKIDELIEYVSKYFTLKIGDIIFTGTPAGVGKIFANDRLTGYIENEALFSIKIK
jgi:2-keto-4-pentenoate hydratase/2-oxohepta-3-ene-1,7-dioic acid hydratase in catechol pathway